MYCCVCRRLSVMCGFGGVGSLGASAGGVVVVVGVSASLLCVRAILL
jgi:hypothetical protein